MTPEAIADATLVLIEERGVNSLTMRALAQHLGVYPATVYWHVGNKAQLLALTFQRVFARIELPDPDVLSWSEWIRAFAHAARSGLGQHPRLAAYFTSQIQVSGASLQLSDTLLSTLIRAGFHEVRLVWAYNTVMSSVFGWISGEFATAPEDTDEAWKGYFEHQLRTADAETLPTIGAHLGLLANQAFMLRWQSGDEHPMHDSFEFMVDVLLDGLAAQLHKNP